MTVATMINGVLKRRQDTSHWVPLYVAAVSLLGICTLIYAIFTYQGDWAILLLFASMGALAELAHVQLFAKSHSRISLGFVFAIAAITALGPWAGALTHFMSNSVTSIPFRQLRSWRQLHKNLIKHSIRCTTFNISMGVLSAACGGQVFLWLGGTPGQLLNWGLMAPLALTVLTDTAVNMGLLIVVISLQTGRKPLAIWVEDWQWAMPITLASGMIGGGAVAVAYEIVGLIGLSVFILPITATSYAFRLYIGNLRSYVDQLEVANRQLDETNSTLLHTLGAVIDAYDLYTFGHSAQVARYAEAIAEAMNLAPQERAAIVRGALIHDIGKIGIADAIVGKQGRLTDDEYATMKLHTVIGAEIVSQMPLLQTLVPMVRNHHERWDGRGYPDGLKGEETPLAARILAVADSVEAMLSDRPYQATRSLEQVVSEVIRCSGQQFDPDVVGAFLTIVNARDRNFFINSATKVEQELHQDEALQTAHRIAYTKKGMVSSRLTVATR